MGTKLYSCRKKMRSFVYGYGCTVSDARCVVSLPVSRLAFARAQRRKGRRHGRWKGPCDDTTRRDGLRGSVTLRATRVHDGRRPTVRSNGSTQRTTGIQTLYRKNGDEKTMRRDGPSCRHVVPSRPLLKMRRDVSCI